MRIAGILLILVPAITTTALFILASRKMAQAERVEAYWHQRQQESDEFFRQQGGGQPWFASRNIAASTVQTLKNEGEQLYSCFRIACIVCALLIPLGSWLLIRSRRVVRRMRPIPGTRG